MPHLKHCECLFVGQTGEVHSECAYHIEQGRKLNDALSSAKEAHDRADHWTHECAELQSRLDAATAPLAKIGKTMNDPLLSQRQRIMIAEDIRQWLETR